MDFRKYFSVSVILMCVLVFMLCSDAAVAIANQGSTASAVDVTGFSVATIAPEMAEELKQSSWHKGCPVQIADLRLVNVKYHDYDGNEKKGELIVHKKLAADVRDIFSELYQAGFRINSIKRIDAFAGNDDLSMQSDNTSSFNFRKVAGSKKLSNHSWGMAVDINPLRNPYITKQGVLPLQGKDWLNRQNVRIGMIVKNDVCYKAFARRGWKWGGSYKSCKDYQHFEKVV